jgi:hypothetical protein
MSSTTPIPITRGIANPTKPLVHFKRDCSDMVVPP